VICATFCHFLINILILLTGYRGILWGLKKHNISTFMRKKLFLLNQFITEDTRICRYMNFDVFLQILNGKIYIPRKQSFLDARECGRIPIKYRFAFAAVGAANTKPKDLVENRQQQIDTYVDNLKKSGHLLTSCWTLDQGEDFLMWKSYAPHIGICARTTIGQLIDAIDYEEKGYLPICSPMIYQSTNTQIDFLESMFTKDRYYISEKEIRIYFVHKGAKTDEEIQLMDNDGVENLLNETSNENIDKNENMLTTNGEMFEIAPSFINSIVLSPFIKKSTLESFINILKRQFGTVFTTKSMIKKSEILIK